MIPTLNMFMIFMNRKTLNYYKQKETKKKQERSCLRLWGSVRNIILLHHKTTPPSQRYPSLYPILLLFSLYFCGIRQYFLQILVVSAHGGPTALNRIHHKTIFCTDPHCVSSWISYSLKQALILAIFLFLFVCINLMSSCSWKS